MYEKGVGNIKYGAEMVWHFEIKHCLEELGTILNMDEKWSGNNARYGLEKVRKLENKHGLHRVRIFEIKYRPERVRKN